MTTTLEPARPAPTPDATAATPAARRTRPWVAWLLCTATLGVYGLWWCARFQRDLARVDPTADTSPRRAVLANLVGCLLVVPVVVHLVSTCRKVRAAQARHGMAQDCNPWLVNGLMLLGCLHVVPLQRRMNALLDAA